MQLFAWWQFILVDSFRWWLPSHNASFPCLKPNSLVYNANPPFLLKNVCVWVFLMKISPIPTCFNEVMAFWCFSRSSPSLEYVSLNSRQFEVFFVKLGTNPEFSEAFCFLGQLPPKQRCPKPDPKIPPFAPVSPRSPPFPPRSPPFPGANVESIGRKAEKTDKRGFWTRRGKQTPNRKKKSFGLLLEDFSIVSCWVGNIRLQPPKVAP